MHIWIHTKQQRMIVNCAQIFKEQQNDRVYSVELDEMEMEKPKSKGGKKNDLQH